MEDNKSKLNPESFKIIESNNNKSVNEEFIKDLKECTNSIIQVFSELGSCLSIFVDKHFNTLTEIIELFEIKNQNTDKIKFMLNGCDISFLAEAPKDITLEQLLKQCNKIKPHWCACGIRSLKNDEQDAEVEILIDYDNITKINEDVSCEIEEKD